MTWGVEPAHPRHINYLARRMREADVIEVEATGQAPKQSLRSSLRASTFAVTVTKEGRPVAMLGVAPVSLVEGKGAPWMLGTDEIKTGARQFVKWGPGLVKMMQQEFPRLENMVGSHNRPAIRVLMLLGFEVDDEIVHIRGVAFRRFRKV